MYTVDSALPSSISDVDASGPLITVDTVMFSVFERDLKVLLVRRANDPFRGAWALPGGFIGPDESLDGAARRVLVERAGARNVYLEQLYTFGEPGRDPRTRVVTVAYYALVNVASITLEPVGMKVAEVKWLSMYELPALAFDHAKILQFALTRMRDRVEHSAVSFELLPEKFTLSELQALHEIILGRTLDKRNFRRKMQLLGVLEQLPERRMDGIHRPAQLYRFRRGEPVEALADTESKHEKGTAAP